MIRIPKNQIETVKIEHFIPSHLCKDPTDIAMTEAVLTVPINTGDIATAAMIKGLYEYFFKELGQEPSPAAQEMLRKAEDKLKDIQQIKPKSSLLVGV